MPDDRVADEQVADVFQSARLLDPTIEVEAIQRFMQEVVEMDVALPALAAEDAPLDTGFTPDWPAEGSS